MSLANKIFKNTVWQVIIRIFNIVIGVLNLGLIARILGQTGFGFYTTIFAFLQMAMILVDFGLYLTLLREISTTKEKQEENKIINNIFTIRFFSSLLFLLAAPIIIKLFPYDLVVQKGIIYFSLAFFFQSLISTLTAVFAKHLVMPKVALTDTFSKLSYFIFLFYFFRKDIDLNSILLINSLIQGLAFILLYFFLRKYVSLRFKFDFKYWRSIFYKTWPLAITVVLNLIYFKVDTLILSAYHPPSEVGLYGAPYRVLEVLTTFPHMFMGLILPLFTAAYLAKNFKKLQNIWQHTFDFFSIISIGMIAGTWLISTEAMKLLAGHEFILSGPILNVLIVATALIFFGTLFTYLVVALQAQKEIIKYFLFAALLGLLNYFIFIPRFSYWGAAYTTLFIELLIVIFAYLVVRKHINLKINFKVLGKSILAGTITLFSIWPWKDFNMFLTIVSFSFLYLFILYLSKAFNKEIIKEVLNK